MSSTLLIWWNIPEEVALYVIPNSELTDEMRTDLNTAQGSYVNGDAQYGEPPFIALMKICTAISDAKYVKDFEEEYQSYGGQWNKYKAQEGDIVKANIDTVYKCGFIM